MDLNLRGKPHCEAVQDRERGCAQTYRASRRPCTGNAWMRCQMGYKENSKKSPARKTSSTLRRRVDLD
eukprot:2788637-Heterocapsa_arctica.AAC.1